MKNERDNPKVHIATYVAKDVLDILRKTPRGRFIDVNWNGNTYPTRLNYDSEAGQGFIDMLRNRNVGMLGVGVVENGEIKTTSTYFGRGFFGKVAIDEEEAYNLGIKIGNLFDTGLTEFRLDEKYNPLLKGDYVAQEIIVDLLSGVRNVRDIPFENFGDKGFLIPAPFSEVIGSINQGISDGQMRKKGTKKSVQVD